MADDTPPPECIREPIDSHRDAQDVMRRHPHPCVAWVAAFAYLHADPEDWHPQRDVDRVINRWRRTRR